MDRSIYHLLVMFLLIMGCQPQEKPAEEHLKNKDSLVQDTLIMINEKWDGTWEREGSIDPATLSISDVSYSAFKFHITTYDGITAGEISGKAILEGNMALFISTDNSDTCQINFILQDSLLVLSQTNGGCTGTSDLDFSGEYYDDRFFKEKVMEEDAARGQNNGN